MLLRKLAEVFGRFEPRLQSDDVWPLLLLWVSRTGAVNVRWGERGRFDNSLFRNGVFCFRLSVLHPMWSIFGLLTVYWFYRDVSAWFAYAVVLFVFVGVHVRWSGSIADRSYVQAYVGPKLSGDMALMPRVRVQSDATAARGTWGPNAGQAVGWGEGPK